MFYQDPEWHHSKISEVFNASNTRLNTKKQFKDAIFEYCKENNALK